MNNKETMGQIIATKRKELGMTQMELDRKSTRLNPVTY